MASKPEVPNCGWDFLEAFHLLTPDFNGNVTFGNACDVLSRFGVTSLSEQMEVFGVFREMLAAQRAVTDKPETPPDG